MYPARPLEKRSTPHSKATVSLLILRLRSHLCMQKTSLLSHKFSYFNCWTASRFPPFLFFDCSNHWTHHFPTISRIRRISVITITTASVQNAQSLIGFLCHDLGRIHEPHLGFGYLNQLVSTIMMKFSFICAFPAD